jgi:phosphoribosyl 1,2-cyclic phosphodiesterase
LRLVVLGSGSSGNVAFVEAAGTRVLVDAGLPKDEIEKRLARVPGPVGLGDIQAVLVTHDHSDHAGCAMSLGAPVYATEGTRLALGWDGTRRVIAGDAFVVGALHVKPVLLPHDALESVGYVLESEHGRVGILTDCGHDAADVAAAYVGCDVLVLETNHDSTLLRHGPYPPSLKRRVGGRRGHLSNDQAASLLRMMCREHAPPQLVVLAHLSQANNRPQLAKSLIDRVLGRELGRSHRMPRSIVASQARPTPVITLTRGRVVCEPQRNEQLSFDFAAPPRVTA